MSELTLHNAGAHITALKERLRKELQRSNDRIAELEEEVAKQVWMLDTFMHNRRYMEIRAGYADIFELVKQDLADDYEARANEGSE